MQISLIASIKMPRTAGSKLIAEVNVEDYVDFESAQKLMNWLLLKPQIW